MAKTDKATTKRPTMGTLAATTVENLSAAPSKNTKLVGKKGPKGGAEPKTASIRQHVYERNGASYTPTATLYEANAAEAGATLRNTVVVPSALGNRDFYLRRRYGQGM